MPKKLFPLRWWLMVFSLGAVMAAVSSWQPGASPALQETSQTLAPGLVLRRFAQQTPAGPTQIYFVRAERAAGWRYQMALAQGSVLQRETVTTIAQREGAPVAVNGGFFAYEGAALGAVKLGGEWVRLPWKNRTALGIAADGRPRIANLQGQAELTIDGQTFAVAGLNGNPVKNQISLLTPRAAATYKLQPGELALEAADGKIVAVHQIGAVPLASGRWLAVANGAAAAQLQTAKVGQTAAWRVKVSPADWDDFSTILGAGPRLVREGKAGETSRDEEFRPDVLQRGPRTGVAYDANGNLLLVVADGRGAASPGLTLPEFADLLVFLGAREALHMDCGPSTVLAVNSQVANVPSGAQQPTVPNAILIIRSATSGAASTPPKS